ncbi:hypothetical protein [Streptomyces sp. NPDC059708]|uniref:hypothetical protein n=1 Tax=Streptomyces sp. NPDC059708 TaxID=3346916 RepID=UPI0036D1FDC8
MASARNNMIQDRRSALRERQRFERLAADEVFKHLDAEEKAREATAGAVAKLVEAVGRDRAGDVTGLEPRSVTAYIRLHEELNGTATDDGESTSAPEVAAALTPGAASVPAQVAAPASAPVAAAE